MNEENGSALAMILVFMLVIAILITTLLSTTLAETKHSVLQEHKTQAHYLGRSGVNLAVEKLEAMTIPNGYAGNDAAINDFDELIEDLNSWAATISPYTVGNESFTLSFEKLSNRDIKIHSKGEVSGLIDTTDLVTLRVRMLTSMLTGGRPTTWYKSTNSTNLWTGIYPTNAGESYLGKGMFLDGSSNNGTSKLSANNDSTVFQASIMQFAQSDSVSLEYSGNTGNMTLDSEIIIFTGGIINSDEDLILTLNLSETVARNKINNTPTSILYIEDDSARTALSLSTYPNGVGFENALYHAYVAEASYGSFGSYPFQANTRYGIVAFGNKVVRANNTGQFDAATDRLPAGLPLNGVRYFYFPHNINLNSDVANELNKLIPINLDDPILIKIKVIDKVTISSQPSIWDKK
jgi:hypothetical protein